MNPSCPCGYVGDDLPFSVAWHIGHRDHHLARFPDVDDITRRNLDSFIDTAKWRANKETA